MAKSKQRRRGGLTPQTTLADCDRLLAQVRAAQGDEECEPKTREKLAARELAILRLRSRIETDQMQLRDLVIRNHPDWVGLEQGIVDCVAECDGCSARLDAFLAVQKV